MIRRELPVCCQNCENLDCEVNEFSGATWWFCTFNVFFPTKKGTCNRQKPYTEDRR